MNMKLSLGLAAALCCGIASAAAVSDPITRQECLDQGGQVVGDIGNGSIFRSGYLCENTSQPPTDVVVAAEGEALAIEGEVCCGGTGKGILNLTNNNNNANSRPEISLAECLAQDGVQTHDIGNGAIHRSDYICETSGQSPIGTIIPQQLAASGEPILPREGSVCCSATSAVDIPTIDLPNGGDNGAATDRKKLNRKECTNDYNGNIVGDIGNGAIFRTDYVCESNGMAPIGNIIVPQQGDEPIAIEGEVCCGPRVTIVQDPPAAPLPPSRMELSRQECTEQGGILVADYGDGTMFRDDYVCESNGESPLANVVPLQGEELTDEGEVCCGAAAADTDDDDDDKDGGNDDPTSSGMQRLQFVAFALAVGGAALVL